MEVPPTPPRLTAVDRYPDLGLIPYDSLPIRNKKALWLLIPTIIGIFFFLDCCLGQSFDNIHLGGLTGIWYCDNRLLIAFFSFVISALSIYGIYFSVSRNIWLKGKGILYSRYCYNGMRIYVENDRFGLLSSGLRPKIPAKYSYMQWYTPGLVLKVAEGGRTFLIDVNGHEIR